MPQYFILEQLSDCAVVIAFDCIDSPWMVVTAAGQVISFEQYLSKFD
jgi:hypothetical protein